jgi:D-glycero-D-manno-heptose 1,7-bisphosphate phosphatase
MRAAAFIDKDGTLIENVPYNVDPAYIRLVDRAEEAIAALAEKGFRIIVISNQPGVALGFFEEAELREMETFLQRGLSGLLDGFYYCTHHPQARCACRKPEPGLLRRAAAEHGLSLDSSWMIGDILDDVEAGRRAGCRTCLIDNGNETEWKLDAARRPHRITSSLALAAELIPPP